MYLYDQKPNTKLSSETNQLLNSITNHDTAVLCGRNNSGKSYLLKLMRQKIGVKASFLGPQRYNNFNMLTPYSPNSRKKKDEYVQWERQFREASQNLDNSPFNLQQAIAELNDVKRGQLIEIMVSLLDSNMEIIHTIPDNSMSQQYISVDGHNISFSSSGYRLITSLVTSLLDDDYDTFLIDEPELGISPEAQGIFADFLFDEQKRKKYFSHIKTLVMATHSTVFLDRNNITNNYFVEKTGNNIDVSKVTNVSDINRIHFFLLGNRLESLYMPSVIVIVEGKCDYQYIERVLHIKYPTTRFSIIQANTDSRIRDVFNVAKSLFGDIQKSPYHKRIFAVLDSVHGTGLIAHLEKMGLPKENIVVWSKNGIEHYYPKKIISDIFQSSESFAIKGDLIFLNGLTYTKNELVEMVVPKVDSSAEYNDEFKTEFLSKIDSVLA